MIKRKLKQLRTKIAMLWFRRWLILGVTLIGAVLGFLLAEYVMTPQFTAENELYFSAYSVDYHKTISDRQLENSRGLAESYAVYMQEPFMFARAEENQPKTLSRHYSAAELNRAIDIRVDGDANVVFFYVTTENPQDSARICDFYSAFSMQEIIDLTGVGSYEIFNQTKIPQTPSFPNPLWFSLVGALIAFILIICYAWRVKQKIYFEKEIKELVPNCVIFACIPEIH